ncbi:MAG: vitamin K-dependent gamma-carboxylase [Parvicellaceae bacterium]|jgi:vitamin K-dependent gamma-carboxylase
MSKEVSASTLGLFRILLGVLLIDSIYHLQEYFTTGLMHSPFFFKYDGFAWLELFEPFALHLFFCVIYLAAVMVILGLYYRFFSIILFLGYTYIFLIDKGHYNNHFYFYSLLLFLLIFVKADAWGALGKKNKAKIPYWNIFILQSQVFVVYFFGFIAKLQGDWLNGFPTRFWMYDIGVHYSEGSTLREMFQSDWFAYMITYGGLAFDGLIGFMLFSKRWRRLAVPILLFFHLSNANIFNIGTFPYTMLAAILLFASPDFVERKCNKLKDNGLKGVILVLKKPVSGIWFWLRPVKQTKQEFALVLGPNRARLASMFVLVWLSVQVLIPLRQFIYPGNPSWTGNGQLFSWRMMLVDTVEGVQIKVRGGDKEPWQPVDMGVYMNQRQFRKSIRTPRSLLQFTGFLADEMKASGVESPEIKMIIYKSVNERPPVLFNDTTLNYALVENSPFEVGEWINDWSESDYPAEFSLDKYRYWKEKIGQDVFSGSEE